MDFTLEMMDFTGMDRNKDGVIDLSEFRKALGLLNLYLAEKQARNLY